MEERTSDDDDNSEVSENWAEDRFHEMTPEETQAKQAAEQDIRHQQTYDSLSVISRETNSTAQTPAGGQAARRSSLMDFMASSFTGAASQIKSLTATQKKGKSRHGQEFEARDAFPRMPWHDLEASISGAAVRDVASHFVQRWNHHRLSALSSSAPILVDIASDLEYTICARCQLEKIPEVERFCPRCQYDLGPINPYSEDIRPELCPVELEEFSFIVFNCSFQERLPFRMQGDCPVVVTSLMLGLGSWKSTDEGILLDVHGDKAEWLQAFGLVPAIGDVIYAINGEVVTQLDSNQLKRLLRVKRHYHNMQGHGHSLEITVTFRRHFIEVSKPLSFVYRRRLT